MHGVVVARPERTERGLGLQLAPGETQTCSPPISYPWMLAGAGAYRPGGVKLADTARRRRNK